MANTPLRRQPYDSISAGDFQIKIHVSLSSLTTMPALIRSLTYLLVLFFAIKVQYAADYQLEHYMTETERHEHALTEKALDRLATWGKDPNSYGGENIAFSLSRQGAPIDAFLGIGDCTPFTPHGKRGTLNGQPPGFTGAPIAFSTISVRVRLQ